MLVKVTVNEVPYVGKRGTVKELPEPEARVLVLLGHVVEVKPEPVVKAPVAKKKRRYRRKDVAKAPEAVVVEPEPVSFESEMGESVTFTPDYLVSDESGTE